MFVKLQLVELRLSPFKLRLCPPRGLCFCFLALLYSLVAAQIACSYCTRDSSPRLNFFLASENASSQPVNLDFHDVLLRKNTFEPAFSPTRSLYNSSFNLNSRNSRLQSNDAEMLIQSLCSWKILIGTFDTAIRKENGSGTSCPFDNSTAATQLFFFSLWCSFSKIEEKVNGNTVVQWSERESPMIATLGPCNLISMKIKDEEAGIFGLQSLDSYEKRLATQGLQLSAADVLKWGKMRLETSNIDSSVRASYAQIFGSAALGAYLAELVLNLGPAETMRTSWDYFQSHLAANNKLLVPTTYAKKKVAFVEASLQVSETIRTYPLSWSWLMKNKAPHGVKSVQTLKRTLLRTLHAKYGRLI
eukprot:TRINITY_DN132_c0_g1_i8.p1 TRINITY_DN132_c0_g1~~TRINITY_DN132_c0_g1_i8.p1  ORF type:complete len:360 (+),score=31.55 TRINITY_DN132_c0_g1_i8:114-1193(+)